MSDLESRALWHLELLGCHDPSEALAPYVPLPEPQHWYDDQGDYLGQVTCWGCGGEGNEIRCVDDLCHGQACTVSWCRSEHTW